MISIIIPIYNQAEKLDKCLKSIAGQTYTNYEVIVVNDRSDDKLSSKIEKHKKTFGHKLEVIHCQKHHGAPHARNRGLRKARGEYVIFCDADIVMKKHMLRKMLDTLKKNKEASYAYSSHMWGHKLFRLWPFDEERLKKMPYIHSTSLVRREHIPNEKWDENIKKLQDWDFWLTMLKHGRKGAWIDEVLFTVIPGGRYSSWVPRVVYRLCPWLSSVKKYNEAKKIVQEKHGIV